MFIQSSQYLNAPALMTALSINRNCDAEVPPQVGGEALPLRVVNASFIELRRSFATFRAERRNQNRPTALLTEMAD